MDDVDLELKRKSLEHDLKSAKPLREIVWEAIKNGVNPRYLSLRYNLPVETLERAREEHLRREEQREHANR